MDYVMNLEKQSPSAESASFDKNFKPFVAGLRVQRKVGPSSSSGNLGKVVEEGCDSSSRSARGQIPQSTKSEIS
ncbi:hypothetical protein KOR42_31820 [Thalassoglobus neptunius]|uniref:Uncharacterized protein n=1 Tax=Thalassoglobus neptunius TaxID=1938619 RepID=A0A5C5WPA3_9PLAN|nr:hypothetical protein KOR42_31820 [Thalassoglobus neptunius]